jgi:hypothetical protein
VAETSAGRKPTGRADRPGLSDRQRELLSLLRANSHRDRAGRLVSFWTQPQLASKLGLSVRTLRRLLDDLREPGSDPRHPADRPPGRRLGLVKVEPTRREPVVGGRVYGTNLYVLVESWPVGLTSGDVANLQVAPEGHEKTGSDLRESSSRGLSKQEPQADHQPVEGLGVDDGELSEPWPVGDDGHLEPVALHVPKVDQLDRAPGQRKILDTITAGLGDARVLEIRRHDGKPSATYTTARGREINLETCSLDDMHLALDQLAKHACSNGDRCDAKHRCKRHDWSKRKAKP